MQPSIPELAQPPERVTYRDRTRSDPKAQGCSQPCPLPRSSPREPGAGADWLDEQQQSLQQLLAVSLGGPARRRLLVAARLAARLRSARDLLSLGRDDLHAVGLAPIEADRLLAAIELGRRANALAPAPADERIVTPEQAFRAVAAELWQLPRERFVVAALDARNRIRRIVHVAEGAADHCHVDPREVFLPAIRERASAVVIAHNHPSGDATPSPDDVTLTRRLASVGALLAIDLIDHIVVGRVAYVSFAQSVELRNALSPPDATRGLVRA